MTGALPRGLEERDGTAFLISTPRDSVTGRNLLADGRVRLSLGPTRDVVVIDGTSCSWRSSVAA
ncbi:MULTISPECIES: hypothetical protein [Micromonospora]|jgi:hypothetical protein|uniref:hypothetical protein n=1 Tax=Micromonospora TaxID=1873 RepID=UPI00191C655B|nr:MULTISPECIES: hypothetical protein [unclassified Micromonospora]MBM0226396.1 hypothetical protein [Micromonospora sp. ATA51]